MADLPDNLINSASEQYIESPYRFTQPVRYFKSNDPYYWEVDNIPIKQLEENILFLKDQISNNLSISGIGRKDLAELRPFCTGSDRIVYVNPGRYTARINDAYRKGINRFNEIQALDYVSTGGEGFDSIAKRRNTAFELSVDVLKQIAGEVVTPALFDNGLFHFLQHHNSEALTGNSFKYSFLKDSEINPGTGIEALPKIKMAVWRAYSPDFGTETFRSDLQQESVEFTRHWGGAVRTSVVNVPDTLSIDIPEFDETAFANTTTSQPTTRIDLLFIYSHPMDASSTSIVKPNGQVPTTITAPQLGILEGAGVIALNEGRGLFESFTPNESGFFEGISYSQGSSVASNYFESSDSIGANGNHRTVGILADQFQSNVGINGEYASIPSPDDLLNLTPLFEQTLSENSLALVGQSILPIAYIVVERGKANIEQANLFDIRPFFRTTELSYNERAGIAAANPPLSFANPAVGKKEVQKSILEVRDHLQAQLNNPLIISSPIAAGTIWGGTKWGPEGPILHYIKQAESTSTPVDANSAAVATALRDFGHGNSTLLEAPAYPGWDINTDYFPSEAGKYRNDRLHSFVKYGKYSDGGKYFFDHGLDNDWYEPFDDYNGFQPGRILGEFEVLAGNGNIQYHHNTGLFVKKYISINPQLLEGYDDYDVNIRLVGCTLRTGQGGGDSGSNSDVFFPTANTGFSYEKNGRSGFTIYVCVGPAMPNHGGPYFCKPDQPTFGYTYLGATGKDMEYWMRESSHFSLVRVMNKYIMDDGPTDHGTSKKNMGGNTTWRFTIRHGNTYMPVAVTYPTVSFEVVGYKGSNTMKNYYSTDGTTPAPSNLL